MFLGTDFTIYFIFFVATRDSLGENDLSSRLLANELFYLEMLKKNQRVFDAWNVEI